MKTSDSNSVKFDVSEEGPHTSADHWSGDEFGMSKYILKRDIWEMNCFSYIII